MAPGPPTTLAVGDRLPPLTLDTSGQQTVALRRTRHDSSVLVLAHADCAACQAYRQSLEEVGEELAAWGGRVLSVVDAAGAQEPTATRAVCALLDPAARVRPGVGVDGDEAAVLVADRFGTVYLSQVAGPDHRLPAPAQLLEEVRHIATQCPECGVPDDPLRGEEAWRR